MAIVNITAENDADFICNFSYTSGSTGLPIDLTGDKLRMGIRNHAADVAEELLLTTENGGLTITNPSGGLFTLTILQSQLVQLQVDTFDHSLVRFHGPNVLRIWSGQLTTTWGPSR